MKNKKKTFFVFLCFLVSNVYSQDTLIINDSKWIGSLQNGLRNGFWQEYSFVECIGDNQLTSEGYFLNGKKHGEWKFYVTSHSCEMEMHSHGNFVNGKKEGKWIYKGGYSYHAGNYRDGVKHGVWILYDREVSNSIVYIKGNYNNGIPEGRWELYNTKNGELLTSAKIKKGQMTGKWKTPTCIGELKINPDTIIYNLDLHGQIYKLKQDCEDMYDTSNKVGKWEYFHNENSIAGTGKYKNGKKEGIWTKYYPNGRIQYVSKYRNGRKEGIWKGYYDNGNIKGIATYTEGKLNGECTFYSIDGRLLITGYFIENNRSGEWKSFTKDSTVINIGHYNGLPDNYKLSRQENSCELGVAICENIIKKSSFGYRYWDGYYLPLDNKQGYWVEYNINGSFIEKGMYNNGQRTGRWEIYNNDELKAIYTYKDGLKDGEFVEFSWHYKYVWKCGIYKNGVTAVLKEFNEGEGQSKEEYLQSIDNTD